MTTQTNFVLDGNGVLWKRRQLYAVQRRTQSLRQRFECTLGKDVRCGNADGGASGGEWCVQVPGTQSCDQLCD